MNAFASQPPVVRLPTGACHVSAAPCTISVILGSCVAVTLHDPIKGLGAACHAFLPGRAHGGTNRLGPVQPCRFVDEAVPLMVHRMLERGAQADRLVAKVFGGAQGMAHHDGRTLAVGRGHLNSEAAVTALAEVGLVPSVMCVGGLQGLKLLFNTRTGEAWVKRLAVKRPPTGRLPRRNPIPGRAAREHKDG